MRELLFAIFKILHIIFFTFVIIGPFTGSNYILLLHLIFIPFLLIHWVFNDNTCAITTAEKLIKKSIKKDEYDPKKDCLTCRLIDPVFDFKKNNMSRATFIYIVTIVLWTITVINLKLKIDKGEIAGWMDLFYI
jgi:hypothetical protein